MMKNNWKKVKLGDLCHFQYGKSLPSQKRIAGEYPVYGSGGITGFHNDFFIKAPGIIIGRKGSIGTVYFSDKNFCPIDTVYYIEENKNIYDLKFLYYLLSNSGLDKLNSDAAVPGLNRNTAHQQKFLIPERIGDQKKIAEILSGYDDLIENNNRRIKILEEMAQAIYKQWFVDFKFPGYEKVKMVDSSAGEAGGELGLIPEGWEAKMIKDFIDIKSGFPFSSLSYVDNGEYGLVTIKIVQDAEFVTDCTTRILNVPENMPEHCFLNEGDILLSLTGNIGRVCLVYGGTFLLNQRVAKLFPRKVEYGSFIYMLFRDNEFKNQLEMLSNGVAQQNLSPIEMSNIKIAFPNEKYMKIFHAEISPMLSNILLLKNKNLNLRQTRDLLLPKLMNGEIDL